VNAEDLKQRTKAYCLRVIRLATSLPKDQIHNVFVRQMVRSATSVAANYRAACLARSKAEFASKMGIVQEEADETLFWIELVSDVGAVEHERLRSLLSEGKEILAIVIASRKTAKSGRTTSRKRTQKAKK